MRTQQSACGQSDEIWAIVLNWKETERTARALSSLMQQEEAKVTLVVVDNESSVESASRLSRLFPNAILLKNPMNMGFAPACNQAIDKAIEESNPRYVFLLNNDAICEPHCLERLLIVMEEDVSIGAAQAMILRNAPGTIVDTAGHSVSAYGIYENLRHVDVNSTDDEPLEIFGATGGAVMYRVKMLKEIGTFDGTFFAYSEDLDLSWRMNIAGWKSVLVPKAIVLHEVGISGRRLKEVKSISARNLVTVVIRYYPLRSLTSPRFIYWLGALLVYSLSHATIVETAQRLALAIRERGSRESAVLRVVWKKWFKSEFQSATSPSRSSTFEP